MILPGKWFVETDVNAKEIYTGGIEDNGIFTSEMAHDNLPQTVVSPPTLNPLMSTVCIFMNSQVTYLLFYFYKLETIILAGKTIYFKNYIKSNFKTDCSAIIGIFAYTICELEAHWKEIRSYPRAPDSEFSEPINSLLPFRSGPSSLC